MSNASEQVERILDKLAQVRQRGLSCFGSQKHQFRLNPPMREKEVQRFEAKHKVSLPPDFRCFLTRAGNGGAGPYYGLYKLSQWNDFIDWAEDDPPPSDFLSRPCPLHPQMSRDPQWERQFDDVASPYQGILTLGTQGCTYMMGLIVTGDFAGRVVYLDADGQPPYVVREPNFQSWYERWLDELLGGYDTHWFGYGLGGNEAKLTKMLEDTATPDADRAEAVHAMRRLPELSKEGKAKVCQLLEDDTPKVRAAACAVVEKFDIPNAKISLPKLLWDESPVVQEAAISANIKVRGNAAIPGVARLVESDSENVARRAFFSLQSFRSSAAGRKHNAHPSRETLLRLLESSPHESIRHYAAHALDWKPEDETLLIRLLHDEQPRVRFYASLGLRQLRCNSGAEAAIGLLDTETDPTNIDSLLTLLGEAATEQGAETLVHWATSKDDFHQLTAIDSLCKLGDARVEAVARALLRESRSPVRRKVYGLRMSNIQTIGEMVKKSLLASPNEQLRRLASRFAWPKWLPGSRRDS